MFSLLALSYILASSSVSAYSSCDPVDIHILLDVESIVHHHDDVMAMFDSIVFHGISEESGLSVAMFGELPISIANSPILFDVSSTRKLGRRKRLNEWIQAEMERMEDRVNNHHKPTRIVPLIESLYIISTEVKAKPRRNLSKSKQRHSKYNISIAGAENNDIIFIIDNNGSHTLYNDNVRSIAAALNISDHKSVYFVVGDDANLFVSNGSLSEVAREAIDRLPESLNKTNLILPFARILEDKWKPTFYNITCPAVVEDLSNGNRMILKPNLQFIEVESIIHCDLNHNLVFIYNDLSDESTTTFQEGDILMTDPDSIDLLPESCDGWPHYKIANITVLYPENNNETYQEMLDVIIDDPYLDFTAGQFELLQVTTAKIENVTDFFSYIRSKGSQNLKEFARMNMKASPPRKRTPQSIERRRLLMHSRRRLGVFDFFEDAYEAAGDWAEEAWSDTVDVVEDIVDAVEDAGEIVVTGTQVVIDTVTFIWEFLTEGIDEAGAASFDDVVAIDESFPIEFAVDREYTIAVGPYCSLTLTGEGTVTITPSLLVEFKNPRIRFAIVSDPGITAITGASDFLENIAISAIFETQIVIGFGVTVSVTAMFGASFECPAVVPAVVVLTPVLIVYELIAGFGISFETRPISATVGFYQEYTYNFTCGLVWPPYDSGSTIIEQLAQVLQTPGDLLIWDFDEVNSQFTKIIEVTDSEEDGGCGLTLGFDTELWFRVGMGLYYMFEAYIQGSFTIPFTILLPDIEECASCSEAAAHYGVYFDLYFGYSFSVTDAFDEIRALAEPFMADGDEESLDFIESFIEFLELPSVSDVMPIIETVTLIEGATACFPIVDIGISFHDCDCTTDGTDEFVPLCAIKFYESSDYMDLIGVYEWQGFEEIYDINMPATGSFVFTNPSDTCDILFYNAIYPDGTPWLSSEDYTSNPNWGIALTSFQLRGVGIDTCSLSVYANADYVDPIGVYEWRLADLSDIYEINVPIGGSWTFSNPSRSCYIQFLYIPDPLVDEYAISTYTAINAYVSETPHEITHARIYQNYASNATNSCSIEYYDSPNYADLKGVWSAPSEVTFSNSVPAGGSYKIIVPTSDPCYLQTTYVNSQGVTVTNSWTQVPELWVASIPFEILGFELSSDACSIEYYNSPDYEDPNGEWSAPIEVDLSDNPVRAGGSYRITVRTSDPCYRKMTYVNSQGVTATTSWTETSSSIADPSIQYEMLGFELSLDACSIEYYNLANYEELNGVWSAPSEVTFSNSVPADGSYKVTVRTSDPCYSKMTYVNSQGVTATTSWRETSSAIAVASIPYEILGFELSLDACSIEYYNSANYADLKGVWSAPSDVTFSNSIVDGSFKITVRTSAPCYRTVTYVNSQGVTTTTSWITTSSSQESASLPVEIIGFELSLSDPTSAHSVNVVLPKMEAIDVNTNINMHGFDVATFVYIGSSMVFGFISTIACLWMFDKRYSIKDYIFK